MNKEVTDLIAVIDKALGLPKPGINVGGGIHVVMPDSWDGFGETPMGWTKTALQVTEEDTLESLQIDNNIKLELSKLENRAKLTPEELIKLEAIDAAKLALEASIKL